MDEIIDNFLEIADILRDNLSAALDSGDDPDPVWRRAFIRTTAPIIEAYIHYFSLICCANPDLSDSERNSLDPNIRNSTKDRIKIVLKSVYSMLHIGKCPDFSNKNWRNALDFLDAGDALMHPKNAKFLIYSSADWDRIYDGATWLVRHCFKVPELLQEKVNA